MIGCSSWEICVLAFSGFIALQSSYLHPDEHFQSLEVLAVRYLGISGSIPWEFEPENAARSFVPLLFNYGPLYYLVATVTKIRDPMTIIGLVRVQNFLVYIAVCRLALKRLSCSGAVDGRGTFYYIATSYLTCSFQSHSFSNSLETVLLILVLTLFNELILEEKNRVIDGSWASGILGFLLTLGVFNRVTFPAFVFLPSLAAFWYYFRHHKRNFALLISVSFVCCLAFVHIDTAMYRRDNIVIAPLNNLLYNFDESNLQLHGLHPRYNHMLLNVPQILGPAVLFLGPNCRNNFTKNLSLLSIISGLLLLSLFKHQELRFLLPLAPQLFCCLNDKTVSKRISPVQVKRLWLAFNLVLAVLMGLGHQGGILKIIYGFQRDNTPIGVHIWWKTYSPPTWMYMNDNLTISTTEIRNNTEGINHIPFEIVKNHIVDLKGCDVDLLNMTLHQFLQRGAAVNLIAPNSVKRHLEPLSEAGSFKFEATTTERLHVDLDHLDFGEFSTFAPGITVYDVPLL